MKVLQPTMTAATSITAFLWAGRGNLCNNSSRNKKMVTSNLFSSISSSSFSSQSYPFHTSSSVTSKTDSDVSLSNNISFDPYDEWARKIYHRLPPLQPKRKRIYLIRHGETLWNQLGKLQGGTYDIALSPTGMEQAHRVGNVLAKLAQLQIQQQDPTKQHHQQHHEQLHEKNGRNTKEELSASTAAPSPSPPPQVAQQHQQQRYLVVSSHLERAEQTANIITEHLLKSSTSSSGTHHPNNRQVGVNHKVKRVVSNKFGEMRFGRDFEGMVIKKPRFRNHHHNNNMSSPHTEQANSHVKNNPHHDHVAVTNEKDDHLIERFHEHSIAMERDVHLCWPNGGESVHNVRQRIKAGLQQIIQLTKTPRISKVTQSPGSNDDANEKEEDDSYNHIYIVAHGRFNRILLPYLLVPHGSTTSVNEEEMKHTQPFTTSFYSQPQENCCINVLDVDMKTHEWTGHVINFFDHIQEWQ